MRINTDGVHYKEVNQKIHQAVDAGASEIILENVRGQRYIGTGLGAGVNLEIHGVPGNDLASFMNGAVITVRGNAQDAVGNTMNDGKVLIHGVAGDIVGYGMRGGKIFIAGDVGYRTGIHMKAYLDRYPVVVVGGCAQDYLGEYMAGGWLVVLNLEDKEPPVGHFTGTGMHGGLIFVRGEVKPYQVGAEVGFAEPTPEEWGFLSEVLDEFFRELDLAPRRFEPGEFVKLYPKSARPYGNLYSY